MTLKRLRNRIDKIDSGIIEMLNDRAKLSMAIGKAKKKSGSSIYVPTREKDVYAHISRGNRGPLSDKSLKAVYREVMSGSLALERPLKIAYLGPEATFTHIAALKKFGASLDYLECNSIADVFTEVERDRADYGVVPIENSTEGAVNHTLDMFVDSDLHICSETYLSIRHNLLSKCGRLSEIKKVYSHQQVFAQCRKWLERNLPGARLVSYASTTEAAQQAKREKGSAAIASKLASERYGLRMLARSIEDSSHNITRFLVIGRQDSKKTGHDKTSVVFSMRDRAGALHDVLAPFKRGRINLTKIESRPSKKNAWKYYFFVDMQGHYSDKKVKNALSGLKAHCLHFKTLGSYPVGG